MVPSKHLIPSARLMSLTEYSEIHNGRPPNSIMVKFEKFSKLSMTAHVYETFESKFKNKFYDNFKDNIKEQIKDKIKDNIRDIFKVTLRTSKKTYLMVTCGTRSKKTSKQPKIGLVVT